MAALAIYILYLVRLMKRRYIVYTTEKSCCSGASLIENSHCCTVVIRHSHPLHLNTMPKNLENLFLYCDFLNTCKDCTLLYSTYCTVSNKKNDEKNLIFWHPKNRVGSESLI